MTKTGQNFDMWSGDHRTLQFTVTQPDEVTPIDLTGATLEWRLAAASEADPLAPFDSTALVTKTTAAGITITDAPNGVCEVALEPVDTDDLLGVYYHELQLTDGGGNITTVAVGNGTIYGDLITP